MQHYLRRFGFIPVALVTVFAASFQSTIASAEEGIAQVRTYNAGDNNLTLNGRGYNRYGSDFEKRRSRKMRYNGPGLDLSQINRKPDLNASVSKRYRNSGFSKSDYQQKQLGSGKFTVFTQQLRARKRVIANVVVPDLQVKAPHYCKLPPGTYTVEGLMIPTISGVPPISIINSLNNKKDVEYDPTRLFIKPEEKKEGPESDHGIKIEAEPYVDVTIGITRF